MKRKKMIEDENQPKVSKSDDYYDPRSRPPNAYMHVWPTDDYYDYASGDPLFLESPGERSVREARENLPDIPIKRGGLQYPVRPWDNPEHDIFADMREAKQRLHERSDYEQQNWFKPLVTEREAATLEQVFGQHAREYIQVIPEGYEVKLTDARLEGEARYQEYVQQGKDADSIAIVSGGLDSTTLVYDMLTRGYRPHLLSFDYGQRHKKELTFARVTAKHLGLRHDTVDLTGITHLISNSALTSATTVPATGNTFDIIEVPEGHYAEETMKLTVVPNRNMIMLSIAAGVAVNNGYRAIATGVHAGDHFVYPDCRPRFLNAAAAAIIAGNQGFGAIPEWIEGEPLEGDLTGFVLAPYLFSSKADIAFRALQLGVPLHLTWSCYKGGDVHCGRCSTCVERLEAIDEAIRRTISNDNSDIYSEDQTEYEDTEYWKQAIREYKEKQNDATDA